VSFADAARPPALENLDEELEHFLCRVSFVLPLYFHAVVLILIGKLFPHALMLSEDQHKRWVTASARAAKSAELEVLVKSQAEKIAQLEKACADLKREKDSVTTGYQRLSEKHKMFTERAEQEKTNLAEAHATEVAKIQEELNEETQNYIDYRLNVHHCLHEFHEVVASLFKEVKARCLPVPASGMKVEEMINWVAGEVQTVPDNMWQLNDNFVILAIEGVLNMLRNEGCQ
jgi:DNA repair exonuclease SbcCD ATPase subunit